MNNSLLQFLRQLAPLWLLLLAATIALFFFVNVKLIDTVTINTALPEHFEGWTGSEVYYCQNKDCMRPLLSVSTNVTVCPECGGTLSKNWSVAEKNLLPQDTVLSKKAYTDSLGHSCMVTIVTSGREHSSIHRPQLCLEAQGNEITKEDSQAVDIGAGRQLELTILKIRKPARNRNFEQLGFYAYWFAGDGTETASHIKRMSQSAFDRVFRGRAIRWSYISISGLTDDAGSDALSPETNQLIVKIHRYIHSKQ